MKPTCVLHCAVISRVVRLASPGTASTAVAMCRECGVGLCSRHLHVEQHEMHLAAGLGKSTARLPARRVVRPACAKAERSR
ncbi:DUF2180 family protein [Streptomyces antarcticus]|uniref:DUF2180 family protein n=1 Tax=Streptomyces antarcticus TaxID=2996458 RepID=UPI00226E2A1E|nr:MULTISPECIES: DUF2180 family protein [unclassified Streptomyces]MCY0940454.1 DUF2180 family protein [Streptomyces sp. H34-AA3]MCZ4082427.1 DUF2180 family protein [Streptomyces sp. H34-S5]